MAKRGNNEGSIYKRADGRWAAVINLGWQDGKRKRKTFYGVTRREVKDQLTTALSDHQKALPVTSDRLTTGQFLENWLVESVKPTLRPRTLQSYAELVRVHLGPGLGRIPLAKLAPEDVQKLINRKLASGLSPRRVQYIHAVLRRALGQAEKWGNVARNVAKLVDAPRVVRTEIKPFTAEESRAFIQAIQDERLEALYILAIATGLRQAELLGLSWSDINLEKRQVTVRNTLQVIDGEYQLAEPKSAKGRRTLVLPGIVVDPLLVHRGKQVADKLRAGSRWHDSDLVFTSRYGTPINRHNLTRDFQALLKRVGLPRQRFHDLRHTAASLLLAQNVQPRDLMEILGHSQISLTMNTYGHVMPAALLDAANRMDAILSG
ncbi:MAG: tyrosine-type recombinase/integrase [Dehalococcoidia bacterium]|jgi:integrase|nr:tyrosine-type recombinase/integrase [Dehalococcoidia bacterium]